MTQEELDKTLKGYDERIAASEKTYADGLAAKDADLKKAKEYQADAEQKLKDCKDMMAAEKAKMTSEARAKEIKAFVETLKAEGKIVPAAEETIVKLMEALADQQAIKFGEKEVTPSDLFKELLSQSGKIVNFAEVTKKDDSKATTPEPDKKDGVTTFADSWSGGTKKQLPVEDEELDKRTKEFMEKNPGTSYGDAMVKVSLETGKKE